MVRRFRGQRKEKRGNISTKTGGRRMNRSSGGGRRQNPQGQSLGNEPQAGRVEGNQGMDLDKNAQRPEYGYMENKQRERKSSGRDAGYESDVEARGTRREGSVEDEDQGLDQSTDLSQRPKEKTEERNEGRPDQLSSGEEEDEEAVSGQGEDITERLDIDRERSTGDRDRRNLDPNSMNTEIEPMEIDEGDEEARGGAVEEDPEGEQFRKRGRRDRPDNRTNNPE
jgi:hypothetical protein